MNLGEVIELHLDSTQNSSRHLTSTHAHAKGYVTPGLSEDDQPLFSLEQVDYFPPNKISSMAVSNNIMFIALETMHLLRIDLGNSVKVEDIEIPRRKIYKMFFDPTGRHLIMTSESGENYYHFSNWRKAKLLTKIKGIIIESIAWNRSADPPSGSSTKEFLIGTRNGLIFEAELEPKAELFRNEERYFKQVYSLQATMPITGMRMEQFPATLRKYVVVAVTASRIYQFIGSVSPRRSTGMVGGSSQDKAIFENLFAKYEANPGFSELPGDLPYSELHVFSPLQDAQHHGVAKTFAWPTSAGIFHGNVVFSSQGVEDSVFDTPQLLPYPETLLDLEISTAISEIPISVALTEFHFVLLYKERIRTINQLSNRIVFDEMIPLEARDKVIGISVDATMNTLWVYTGCTMFELVITREDRDVWALYLEQKQYDMALQYTKNPAQKDRVLTIQANHDFSQGHFMLSAKHYAQSTVGFEEVALKFIGQDELDALRSYLLAKMDKLGNVDITQKTIICTWLVEIYLNNMNQLKDLMESSAEETYVQNRQAEQSLLEDEFKSFLEANKIYLDKKTTYKLLASDGWTDHLLFYAVLIGDYEPVINHWIQEKDYKNALDVLSRQNSLDLYYRFSPALMENVPYETVSTWTRQPNLNPRDLIPSLLHYDCKSLEPGAQNQAIRYLLYAVTQLKSTDPAIHNYLLTLYATQLTQDETDLLTFLVMDERAMHYNLDYALRVCLQNKRIQSCIFIYSSMGLYDEAVDLALENNDLRLALINANMPEDDDILRKSLWLKIARHVIKEKKDVRAAMRILSETELVKIEDILALFPDFVLIDDFKEEICMALERYSMHIDELKEDMDEATTSAENIRIDVRELRSRFAVVTSAERCTSCDSPLLTRQFYIFPCQHAFHADCLIKNLAPFLSTRQLRRIEEIQEQIQDEMHNQQKIMLMNSSHSLQPLTAGNPVLKGMDPTVRASVKAMVSGGVALATAALSGRGLLGIGIEGQSHRSDLMQRGGQGGDDMTVVVPRLGLLRDQLDDLVACRCLLCGEMTIDTIDQPFLSNEEGDLELSWR